MAVRYRLDRVDVARRDSRPASWTFAGTAMRGTEHTYVVTDRNFPGRNAWEFVVRVPEQTRERIEVRPRAVPPVKIWEELPDRSLTFVPATRGPARAQGRWYCMMALADATGDQSKRTVKLRHRSALPRWLRDLDSRVRTKDRVKLSRGTDQDALVILTDPDDHADLIRLFFVTKVWVLKEGFALGDGS